MLKRLWRPLGFFLTFSAIAAFVLHPNHAQLKADAGSSHCCVCHTVPMGASRPQVDHIPVSYVVSKVIVSLPFQSSAVSFSPDSPRGPPAA